MEKIPLFLLSALVPATLLSIVIIVQRNKQIKKEKQELIIKKEMNRRRIAESLRRNTFV